MSLPDADALLIAAIKATVADVKVGTQVPNDMLKRLPFVVARRFGGAAVHPQFLDRATVQVDVWAATRKAASDLASQIRLGLYDAARNQTVYTGIGNIARFSEVNAPSELRTDDQADNVWRFQAAYSLFLRPAAI